MQVPYTWDSEKILWSREDTFFQGDCPLCPGQPGLICISGLQQYWAQRGVEPSREMMDQCANKDEALGKTAKSSGKKK